MTISPAQCRAARGLLGISQADLAKMSGVGMRTIAGFERGQTKPIRANLTALQRALEDAGVVLIARGVALQETPPTQN